MTRFLMHFQSRPHLGNSIGQEFLYKKMSAFDRKRKLMLNFFIVLENKSVMMFLPFCI